MSDADSNDAFGGPDGLDELNEADEVDEVDEREERGVREDEYEKDMDKLVEVINGTQRGGLNVRQRRARDERKMRDARSVARKNKRNNTILRASMPRGKHNRPHKKQRVEKVRGKLPDVDSSHEARLTELERLIAAGEEPPLLLETYTANYNTWIYKRVAAMQEAISADEEERRRDREKRERREEGRLFRAHRRALEPSLVAIAKAVPHGTGAKLNPMSIGYVGGDDIRDFFPKAGDQYQRQCRREFDRLYHDKIRLARREVVEWPDTLKRKLEIALDLGRPRREDFICDDCKCDMSVNTAEGTLVCTSCGISVKGGDGVGFKETFAEAQMKTRGAAPYDRLAHFKEFISRLEANERTEVPKVVMHLMLTQCAMHRIDPIRDWKRVTYDLIRGFLQKTGYSHCFGNIPQIISHLTNRPPKRFTEDQKKKLTQIFKEIQEPFERNKGNRKNFLSYSFTTYKSCELLGLTDFLPYLPLLKAHENLLEADRIWMKICREVDYQFIPTA